MNFCCPCAICGKSIQEQTYHKTKEGGPLYWASPRFFSNLSIEIYFCSPEHSTEWYSKQYQSQLKFETPKTG
jgi:YHS domain-containing protein